MKCMFGIMVSLSGNQGEPHNDFGKTTHWNFSKSWSNSL